MVDLDWQTKMVRSNVSSKSPKLCIPALQPPLGQNDITAAPSPLCTAYDNYLRLPQLRPLWASTQFPEWPNEAILKPSLHALELTFHFLATVLSDPRAYVNKRQWTRRLESLATAQIEIISILCEDEEQNPDARGKVPLSDLHSFSSGTHNRCYSEKSMLPRLATWHKSRDVARRILATVECQMTRCTYTLGLGEPNLAAKPILRYDAVCTPTEIHLLVQDDDDDAATAGNYESRTVRATHQISECWTRSARLILERVERRASASECHVVERIWDLLTEVVDLHVMMDPEDFLRMKRELGVGTVAFWFRSRELVEVAEACRDLRRKVPEILEVEVDPTGGPGMMEAAMRVYAEKRKGFEKVHVLQAMQAIEVAMKRFFYAYKQVLTLLIGSSHPHALSPIFLQPTYFPSLDAAKTFLSFYWDNNHNSLP
ncbi:hypothetical protein Fmac_031018 [Flemingia macrophylla]|uniref:Nematode resistance protein-like HSPRO2 n=1 Tax=Flemingia macrophylla TaxID=520843 RepID=A0ABD1L0U4_9FABA